MTDPLTHHTAQPGSSEMARPQSCGAAPFPSCMPLTPLSRRPIELPVETVMTVMAQPIPTSTSCYDPSIAQISIVVVTFNNLAFTRMCLESVLANSEYPNFEVYVVDNASTDGTREYLSHLAVRHTNVRLLLNETNLGFAAANNQGLRMASGEILVLLNNDTIVPRGWLRRVSAHLQDPKIVLLGAATNRSGNEAEIPTTYSRYGEFEQFAADITLQHSGQCFDIRTATMFCVGMRRDVFNTIGPLDEQFGLGMFEDDDYSMRVRAAGLRVVCADDVFVHHFGQASFGKLAGEYGTLFHANRRRWEEKWSTEWKPYGRRSNPRYQQLIDSIREIVDASLPASANVVVVSRGDEELLRLGNRKASHFPQAGDGSYAGHYPEDSAAAIDHLEELRREGVQFLIVPETSLWWLNHYTEFAEYLREHYWITAAQAGSCLIVRLFRD